MKQETAKKIAKKMLHYFAHDLDRGISDHMSEILPEMMPSDRDRICNEMTGIVMKIASEES